MSYLSNIENGSLEAPGCGSECKCGPCKTGLSGLDELYVKEEDRGPSSQSQTVGGRRPSRRITQQLGQTPTLRHFTCPAADHKEIEDALRMSIMQSAPREALDSALRMVVPWLHNAASKLMVSPRDPGVQTTFHRAFGTTPEFVPTWRKPGDKWVDRGHLVALRLLGVARILTGGSIRYFCWGRPGYCPECTKQPPAYFACSSFRQRYVICLGSDFWQNWNQRNTPDNAITLLHEGLHIYFGRLISHQENGPYGNAFCYERYVLEMNGQNVPAFLNTVCPPKP